MATTPSSTSRVPRAGAPVLRLRFGESRTWLVLPASQKLIGRDQGNHILVQGPTVSRFHARITWTDGHARPMVEDLGSVNGTYVDGEAVRSAGLELRDGATLALGTVTLGLELIEDRPPALLGDSAVHCQLFSEVGTPITADFDGRDALRRVLLDVEARGRTGTLHVVRGDLSRVTFARGRIVDARSPSRRGLAALMEIFDRKDAGTYELKVEFEPRECALNVSVSDFLARRHRRDDPTDRLRSA
jgi:hypothetical protein